MGTDGAIETADVALMGKELRHLSQAFTHARHARRIMLQNVGPSLAIVEASCPWCCSACWPRPDQGTGLIAWRCTPRI